MKIKRLDSIELRVLNCAHPDGIGYYYPNGKEAKRAILLMDEGIINKIPESEWSKSGWELTNEGLNYFDSFIITVRNNHGHEWMTRRDSDPYFNYYNKGDKRENDLDNFAYSSGYCNGYVCKNCGLNFCHHCDTELDIEICSEKENRK